MLRIPVTHHIHTNAYEQARRLRLYIPGSAALRPYLRGDGGIRTLDPLLARQVLSQLSYTPMNPGIHLLSHIVSNIVPSAACVLTVVFGMGTGVPPKRIATRNLLSLHFHEPS